MVVASAASTPLLSFLKAGCPSCRPTNNVKALKAHNHSNVVKNATDTHYRRQDVIIDTVRIVCDRVYETIFRASACLSACLCHLSTAACHCSGFAAVGRRAKDIDRSTAAATGRRSSTTLSSSKCEQCHAVSRRRKLDRDWLHHHTVVQTLLHPVHVLTVVFRVNPVSWFSLLILHPLLANNLVFISASKH